MPGCDHIYIVKDGKSGGAATIFGYVASAAVAADEFCVVFTEDRGVLGVKEVVAVAFLSEFDAGCLKVRGYAEVGLDGGVACLPYLKPFQAQYDWHDSTVTVVRLME